MVRVRLLTETSGAFSTAPAKYGSRCPKVPSNFNPSPYFSTMVNSAGAEVLVFGAGGNNVNFRWRPDHGFYVLSETSSDKNPICLGQRSGRDCESHGSLVKRWRRRARRDPAESSITLRAVS